MKVYQKPTCSKCRNLLKTLQERKIAFDSINYYTEPLSANELKSILQKLDMRPQEIMRTGEQIYKDLGIRDKTYTDEQLIELMVKYPDLIQRPIVVRGNNASIVRSQEAIDQLLANS